MTAYARGFIRSAGSIGKARDFVAGIVGTADRADDIRLCVSELATNALLHGTPRGRQFRVHVAVGEGVVRIEVHDASDALPRLLTPAETDDRGRGLQLVDALADDWGTSGRLGIGKVVWTVFKIPCGTLSSADTDTE
ncbi:ATP-binding protein [Streptomyces sp. CMB-StM0423]|uniref:ATP-binding protein n=1 Tax=Streptomyces sp. CMB-StM0423 TaxID=2059884 RepID=UPI000C702E41|nr:ATP-binding protein [Streptomyces sp. CMB-StM0423]AUH42040.1 ATP-binding protein [Streptomyces sp. CMB-StM0423]